MFQGHCAISGHQWRAPRVWGPRPAQQEVTETPRGGWVGTGRQDKAGSGRPAHHGRDPPLWRAQVREGWADTCHVRHRHHPQRVGPAQGTTAFFALFQRPACPTTPLRMPGLVPRARRAGHGRVAGWEPADTRTCGILVLSGTRPSPQKRTATFLLSSRAPPPDIPTGREGWTARHSPVGAPPTGGPRWAEPH